MLDEILSATRRRLGDLRARSDEIIEAAAAAPPPPSFASALAGEGMAVIAEIKRRSPSRGEMAPDLDPLAQARAYADGGAAAISVLTEPEFFAGSPRDLVEVADIGIPILRKDFILDPLQILEAVAWGAAAVLLIVAALEDEELENLLETSRRAGIDALVEVHTADEARRAVEVGARIVGVNNRDLADFNVDLATAESLARLVGPVDLKVAESGIFTPADAGRMRRAGYDAVLVGEALV
ncbi:MAG: indole-3-glycerol phosphate synthase TrpC, partial [Acidimicrobiia bacterium]